MNRSRFLTISFILLVFFLFLKIYQHNRIFSVIREKQRVERTKKKLEKKKNHLLVELYKMKDQKLVSSRAEKELGLVHLKPNQIVTIDLDHSNQFTIRS